MTDFETSWNLSRTRLIDEVASLNDAQLQWKLYPNSLSIGQMCLHVVGVEISFTSQLLGKTLDPEEARLKASATEGVVNQNPFPFEDHEITAERVKQAFDLGKSWAQPLISNPSPEVLKKELKSALGPMISGQGALARFAFHPAYHQGEAYLMKNHPSFPVTKA